MTEKSVPISNRARVREWIQKLGTKDHLAFSGQGLFKQALKGECNVPSRAETQDKALNHEYLGYLCLNLLQYEGQES